MRPPYASDVSSGSRGPGPVPFRHVGPFATTYPQFSPGVAQAVDDRREPEAPRAGGYLTAVIAFVHSLTTRSPVSRPKSVIIAS